MNGEPHPRIEKNILLYRTYLLRTLIEGAQAQAPVILSIDHAKEEIFLCPRDVLSVPTEVTEAGYHETLRADM